jgi:hypothetical protein
LEHLRACRLLPYELSIDGVQGLSEPSTAWMLWRSSQLCFRVRVESESHTLCRKDAAAEPLGTFTGLPITTVRTQYRWCARAIGTLHSMDAVAERPWMGLPRVSIALAHHLLSDENLPHKVIDFLFGKLNTAVMTLRTLLFSAPRQGLALNSIILLAIIINNWRES